jgi:uncharacterized membrane protein YfcA
VSVFVLILIFLGGSVAGVINVMAGGGSLITLPLLIFAGLPPTVANGTNRVAIVLQNVGALAGFRRNGLKVGGKVWLLLIPSLLGAYIGVRLAVNLDETAMRRAIGVILVVMLVPLLRRRRPRPPEGPIRMSTRWWVWPIYFLVGAYGGFLQAGVGFFYLALLVGLQGLDLVRANLVKVFLILMYSILALALFLAGGKVALVPGLTLAAGNTLGGWVGAHLAVRKGERWIKVVLAVAVIVSAAELTGLARLLARVLGIGG